MTNPMFTPQPNYSGVTIQIANPTVNTNPMMHPAGTNKNVGYVSCPQAYYCYPQSSENFTESGINSQKTISPDTGYQNAYPAQYYLNNYNYQGNGDLNAADVGKNNNKTAENIYSSESVEKESSNEQDDYLPRQKEDNMFDKNAVLKHYDTGKEQKTDSDMSKSTSIIGDIDEREAQMKADKENTKEKRIVALTDEYIKSLENYLNNPNDEIRLMASKEILTRLDEDKDRYDDAALNALLNKMLQDPSKLVRIAALSAFGSQLACGNDYTVQLLQNIQSNPSADKEDVLQAADILLKMSAGTEVKNIPVPPKNTNQ